MFQTRVSGEQQPCRAQGSLVISQIFKFTDLLLSLLSLALPSPLPILKSASHWFPFLLSSGLDALLFNLVS